MIWPTLDGSPPRIIAHRGASGPLPEHTLEAYTLALEQGADVVEPDLVSSRDAQLVVRHDRNLARSTDIATRTDFAARRRDGDWWIEDFDLADIASLRAVQPFPSRDRTHDGRFRIPTFAATLLWAETVARRRGTAVTLYPELKSPAFFAAQGKDPCGRFLSLARQRNPIRVNLWLQCFELEPLLTLRESAEVKVFLLMAGNTPWRRLIARHAGQVDGFGVHKSLLQDVDGSSSGLVDLAHEHGCLVHAYTYRDDGLAAGFATPAEELDVAFAMGVDGVFCDFPKTAVQLRDSFLLRA
ncbi:glycerophosphodiester phosphodiesterase family protein [Xanthomonadaceae bacterium JHOS43]|nr:glycerophosphodiester phosphodiesterase family protein [Xanthomonadaceae bacterium JHOS43]